VELGKQGKIWLSMEARCPLLSVAVFLKEKSCKWGMKCCRKRRGGSSGYVLKDEFFVRNEEKKSSGIEELWRWRD